MRNDSNLAVLPMTKDKDGDDGGEPQPLQVMIDSAQNGFILNITGGSDEICKVFLFHGKAEDGPNAMIQTVIDQLGLADKVKLQR